MGLKKIITVFFVLLTFYGYSQTGKIIARISITGNNKTKENIILREITFQSGDSIPDELLDEKLERSRANLINSLLFNYVEIKKIPVDSVFTDIHIHVTERIYLIPTPIFQFADPNFNTWWLNKDFSRTNWGFFVLKKNFRGRNEDLAFITQFGYSKEFGFLYRIPYITKKQNIGAGIWAGYKQNNEITIGTENNKRLFYTGTTGNSRDELLIKLNTTIRRKLYSTHFFELKYNSNHILDTITKMQGDYFFENKAHMNYLSFIYVFKNDKRDNKSYPLTGHFTQVDLVKNGLGIISGKFNVLTANASHSEYFQLSDRFFFASQIKAKFTLSKNIPYYFQEGLGYGNFIRGYEYYVVDGQHFGLVKTGLKYTIVKPRVHKFQAFQNTNFANIHYAFYLNFYIDAGYVYDERYSAVNPLSNQLLYGSGIGLDFVSFYDKVIRFEYSLNKQWEHGFFLHFIKPI